MRLGLAAALPAAMYDDLGMCSGKSLRVSVRPKRDVPKGAIVTTGSYTYGRITLTPCFHCNSAFLTQVFLHELVQRPDASRRGGHRQLHMLPLGLTPA